MNEPANRFDELKAAAEAAGDQPVSPDEARELELLWNKLDLSLSENRSSSVPLTLKHRTFDKEHPVETSAIRRTKLSTRIFIWSAGIAAVVTLGAMLFQIWVMRAAYDVLQTEMLGVKTNMVLSSLRSDSAAERLEGLLQVARGDFQSDAMVQAVVHRLASDPNTNIRLASVRALVPYKDQPEVLDSLRNAARMERSPLVILQILELVREADPVLADLMIRDLSKEGQFGPFLEAGSEPSINPSTTDL